MGLFSKIIGVPTIGKMMLRIMKKRAFKPFQVSLEEAFQKQNRMLEAKFDRLERTEIGRKLGVRKGVKIEDLQVTDYSFYEPFYNNPSPGAFMYPLKDYIKVRTSGTAGKEKWFMTAREELKRSFIETAMLFLFTVFHDGEKPTIEYEDKLYINTAPRPFTGGFLVSSGTKYAPVTIVPNINLSYHDKVRYFIYNYEKIDGAFMTASSLISQIMPAIGKPIKLKGLLLFDSPIAEVYEDKIEKFAGTIPKASYSSTETFISTLPSVQHPLGFIFDWRRGMFEFLPIKGGKAEKNSIRLDRVNVGEVYRLIFTSFIGELTRYDTKDSFECIAIGDDILGTDYPIFKFRSRQEKTISIQNFTRISEDELLTVFKETGIPFIDFTARTEIEKGFEKLVIYIEHPGDMSAKGIQKLIHKKLYEMDKDYRDLVDFFNYTPIKIHLMPKGVFAKYLEEKIASVPKVERINMRDEEFERLTRLIENDPHA